MLDRRRPGPYATSTDHLGAWTQALGGHAAVALVVVLRLPEAKLRTGGESKQADRKREPAGAGAER